MLDPTALVQQHSDAIIGTLQAALRSSDPRAKLEAAKLLLLWGWGPRGDAREDEADPPGGLSLAKQRQAIALLLPHLGQDPNTPDPSATSCPARHGEVPSASPPDTPPANPAINPMSPEPTPSPLAAPPGTDSPRRDADPVSRALLLASNRADDPFYRRLPTPPPMEPPGLHAEAPRKRWPPWR
jgi:hypothetical protein